MISIDRSSARYIWVAMTMWGVFLYHCEDSDLSGHVAISGVLFHDMWTCLCTSCCAMTIGLGSQGQKGCDCNDLWVLLSPSTSPPVPLSSRRGGIIIAGGHPQSPARGESLWTPFATVIARYEVPKQAREWWSGRHVMRRLIRCARNDYCTRSA